MRALLRVLVATALLLVAGLGFAGQPTADASPSTRTVAAPGKTPIRAAPFRPPRPGELIPMSRHAVGPWGRPRSGAG